MFTGIVEESGRVEQIRAGARSTELSVRSRVVARGIKTGASLAVNGACLTVVAKRGAMLRFDVLNETLRRTNLAGICRGDRVNLERPLRIAGRLDGHFVLGHVDGRGRVRRWERAGKDYVLEVAGPANVMRYVVEKGSIAVDGMSLTVAGVGRGWFRVWVIPHTRALTNLVGREVGDFVNLEADIIGKYVEKLLAGKRRGGG